MWSNICFYFPGLGLPGKLCPRVPPKKFLPSKCEYLRNFTEKMCVSVFTWWGSYCCEQPAVRLWLIWGGKVFLPSHPNSGKGDPFKQACKSSFSPEPTYSPRVLRSYWLKKIVPRSLLGHFFVYQVRQVCHLPTRRAMMAAFSVTRSSCGLINGLKSSFGSLALAKHGALASAMPQQILLRRYSVKERIDKKRKAALVGGGQNRIDAQHKRVKAVIGKNTYFL